MGANLSYLKFSDSLGKSTIQKKWDEARDQSRYEDGTSYSGEIGMLLGKIQWKDRGFASKDEAREFMDDNHEKGDDPMAVSYKDAEGQKMWIIGGWCPS